MTDLRGLLTDDDAVSPVIGVVLMVAVTVILSAAIGAFVLDIGSAVTEQRPNAVIEFEYTIQSGSMGSNPDSVTLRHNGGDRLETTNLRVTIDGSIAWDAGTAQSGFAKTSTEWDDGVVSGDELVLEEDGSNIEKSLPVQVVWQQGRQSSVIASSNR